ncbi:MnhB domain-containing protein [Natrialba asiatica]|uniref:Monovalent cation/H+ antiporter subunit B n=1 Tax=Natrialba asiatica (strain ATCC 700177 / DSM 12278 / JCM 9576 / FERM P-10747 / NBRC 102637 / 172P1) TaxID=29540 RepID=M0AS90_NATA1|nr:MnhB domain-containing protein [Natrialba asiatica]ELZ00818.1 monovalent cation/H+ antiporter subunit B [Natrialba asiatica DSM 12278]
MSQSETQNDTYSESHVILTSVRILSPFTLTYGLFLALHGTDTPGGSFQGGAIIGVTILMLAFAFGIEPTRRWLKNSLITGLVTGGVTIFVATGLATMVLGGTFLEFDAFTDAFGLSHHWGMEAVEVGGVALIVSGVVVTLFFAMAAGFTPERYNAVQEDVAEVSDDD